MANGEPITATIDRIEAHVLRVERKVDEQNTLINSINAKGCAKGASDELRISNLEGWRDKGIFAVISALGTAIYSLFKP